VDGKKVATSEDLANIVASKKPGQVVTVKLLRADGKGGWTPKTVEVTLGSRPSKNPFESSSGTPEG